MRIIHLLALCFPCVLAAQYDDPNIPVPASGYGSDGNYTVAVEAFENVYYPGKDIRIYHPAEISTPVPVIFYSHAYGGFNPANIFGLTDFVAKKGYAFVFVPYQTTGVSVENRYENLLAGFRKAARDFPGIIDTTKVGFMGHSFGGGASFASAYSCFTENNWGSAGRFVYASAQWYSYNISQTELQNFPNDVRLISEIYADDSTNDHRLAADIFSNIGIPDTEKDFLILQGDTINGYVYEAGHGVPNCVSAFNALDYYGIYRLLDALCDYTWTGNLSAKIVALGNGSAAQVTMPGGLKPMLQTDHPVIYRLQSGFEFPCDTLINLRVDYCDAVTEITEMGLPEMGITPNPSTGKWVITGDNRIILSVVATDGKQIPFTVSEEAGNQELQLQTDQNGVYLVQTDRGVLRLELYQE